MALLVGNDLRHIVALLRPLSVWPPRTALQEDLGVQCCSIKIDVVLSPGCGLLILQMQKSRMKAQVSRSPGERKGGELSLCDSVLVPFLFVEASRRCFRK